MASVQCCNSFWLAIFGAVAVAAEYCRCAHPDPCFHAAPWKDLASLVPLEDTEVIALEDKTSPAYTDPLWLLDQPGGMQQSGAMGSLTRAGWAATNSTSAKVVRVRSAQDAANAVKFAAKHNLALSVKATGHDWFGRSALPGSLMLWTHGLDSIAWSDDFTPASCHESVGNVVTVGAGVTFWQLYDAATARGQMVVGGTCSTVGHVGFSLFGGYGDYSRMFGSGATNLVEAEVVLADGRLVIASACNDHADLFRALRGGGAGFGLATKLTYRTFPMPTAGTVGEIKGQLRGDLSGHVSAFLKWYRDIVQRDLAKHFGGKVFVYQQHLDVQLTFVDLSSAKCAQLITNLPSGLLCSVNWRENIWKPENAATSENGAAGWMPSWAKDGASAYHTETISRYFKSEHLQESDGKRQLFADTLIDLVKTVPEDYNNFLTISLNYALGGSSPQVQALVKETSTHPDVAEALGIVKFTSRLRQYAPIDEESVRQDRWERWERFRSKLTTLLGESAGSYANEGDYGEENWQQRYWGANYPGLLATKENYDPEGVFTCYQCVGNLPVAGGTRPQCPGQASEMTTLTTTASLELTTHTRSTASWDGETTTSTFIRSEQTTTSVAEGSCVKRWAQCGGSGWTGDTWCCDPSFSCVSRGEFYSQCLRNTDAIITSAATDAPVAPTTTANIATITPTSTVAPTTTAIDDATTTTTIATSATTMASEKATSIALTLTSTVTASAISVGTTAVTTSASPSTSASTAVQTTPTSTAFSSTSSLVSSTTARVTSTLATSTAFSSTSSVMSSTTAGVTTTPATTTMAGRACAANWAQCGGLTWSGPTRCCDPSLRCVSRGLWYSQCSVQNERRLRISDSVLV